MPKKKVVVVGGGFGGIYAARKLAKKLKSKIEIVVIDKRNYFLFTPLLHEVATATIDDKVAVESIASLVSKYKLVWKVGKVKKINLKSKELVTESFIEKFDYLVLAVGSTVNTYGIEGVENNSFRLKNLADAINLKHEFINRFQEAAVVDSERKRKRLLTFTIVGAGPTGIELAGEISDFAKDICKNYFKNINFEDVTLNIINSSEYILPNQNKKLGKWVTRYLCDNNWKLHSNCRVAEVKKEELIFNNGKKLFAGLIIWSAGVKPNKLVFDKEVSFNNSRLSVGSNLELKAVKNVYALGDIADGFPMLAQVAVQQADVVASNIVMRIKGKKNQKTFKFNNKGFLVSVGKWKAVGEVFGVPIKGPIVWLMWHAVYFFKFVSNTKRIKVLIDWVLNVFRSRDISSY